MDGRPARLASRQLSSRIALIAVAACLVGSRPAVAQGQSGMLIGTVKNEDGGVLVGATVRLISPALIGGPATQTTNDKGQLRFPALPPGSYVLDIEKAGFASRHEEDIRIGAGATIERNAVLQLTVRESIVVEGAGARIDARDSGLGTRFGSGDLNAIPIRRFSGFDWLKTAPGISPTTPAGGTTLVSAFGSGVDQNLFFIDGTNVTATSNGMARADLGIDFIQEIQIKSAGASAEYGNAPGAVVNVVTKSGSNLFRYDAAYYAQTAGLTSQPVRLAYGAGGESGYERRRYRDATTSLGGPVARNRVWFFAGYQYLRDASSQPGTDPSYPKVFEQNKIFAKLTWRLTPGWQLVQSFHGDSWVTTEVPTAVKPFNATQRLEASVPATTFGHLTHVSARTVWEVSAGRFRFAQEIAPSSGDRTIPSRLDRPGDIWSNAPQQIGEVAQVRTTAKATVTHFRSGPFGTDHEWKIGVEADRGEHRSLLVIPTGARYIYSNQQPSQRISQAPANAGGRFIAAAAFVTDAVTLGDRVTISAGLRFDHSRAISQDLLVLDADGRDTGEVARGLGTLYAWNTVSPRLGATVKLDAEGRTILRASYGKYSQGVLSGELSFRHPGQTAMRTEAFDPATGDYTNLVISTNPKDNVNTDPEIRAPRTDQYSIGVDREIGRRMAVTVALVRKDGRDFIGWVDIGGQYREESVTVDGRSVPVFRLTNGLDKRFYLLTNPDGYSSTYNGLVIAVERRRSEGWQAFGSYTLSRAYGLVPSSGTTAAGAQVSTVGAPPVSFAPPVTFGRDPNDLTNARGRLPNDWPHMFRLMGAVDVPHTGVVVAANLQHYSGKPWAATALINPQDSQRSVLIEPRGSRRLSSQTLLDLRVSRPIRINGLGRVDLCLDVLNVLNGKAEESVRTEILSSPTFDQANTFMDPRRAMLSVRFSVGR